MRQRTLTFTVVAIFLAWNIVTYVFILSKQPSKVSSDVTVIIVYLLLTYLLTWRMKPSLLLNLCDIVSDHSPDSTVIAVIMAGPKKPL